MNLFIKPVKSGEFHRFYKEIHKSLSELEQFGDITVQEGHINSEPYNVELTSDSEDNTVCWYYTVSNQTVTYDVSYTVTDVVKRLNDSCVFSYRFIGNHFSKEIDNAYLSIHAPDTIASYKLYNGNLYHSDDTGEIYNGLETSDTGLNAKSAYAETVVMKDTGYFDNTVSRISMNYAEIDFSQVYADMSSASAKENSNIEIFMCFIFIVFTVSIVIKSLKKSNSRGGGSSNNDYFGCSSRCSSGCSSGCGGGCGGGGAD